MTPPHSKTSSPPSLQLHSTVTLRYYPHDQCAIVDLPGHPNAALWPLVGGQLEAVVWSQLYCAATKL